MTAIEIIAELFSGPGARDHLGEPVPIGEHMLQAGALAEAAGAEGALVAAALLHDIGHLLGEKANRPLRGPGGSTPPEPAEPTRSRSSTRPPASRSARVLTGPTARPGCWPRCCGTSPGRR